MERNQMLEVADLLSDILNYSPIEKGEIRLIRPMIRQGENGLNTASSPLSPFSPAIAFKSDSPSESDLEKIRTWLSKIGEPEEDHLLVIDKCRNDPQALEYFLKYARGEFEANYTLTDKDYSSPDDRIMCRDCLFLFGGHCQQYEATNHGMRYRPVQDVMKRCSVFKPKKDK
jgi:hypothetical protein